MVYFVYIMASKKQGTLYVGVTNDVRKRAFEHKQGLGSKFTKQYGVNRLVYLESFDQIEFALQREKRMKRWKRAWKIELIERENPDWQDLYSNLL